MQQLEQCLREKEARWNSAYDQLQQECDDLAAQLSSHDNWEEQIAGLTSENATLKEKQAKTEEKLTDESKALSNKRAGGPELVTDTAKDKIAELTKAKKNAELKASENHIKAILAERKCQDLR